MIRVAMCVVLVSGLGLMLPGPASAASNATVQVRIGEWHAVGPFGSPELVGKVSASEVLPPNNLGDVRNYNHIFKILQSASYKMDPGSAGGGEIDLDATYCGPETCNAAGKQLTVSWKPVALGEDGNVSMKPGSWKNVGVTYLSTWIFVPSNTTGRFTAGGYGLESVGSGRVHPPASGSPAWESLGVDIQIWVNRYPLRTARVWRGNPVVHHPIYGQTVYFKAGWNHVLGRYMTTWAELRPEMVLEFDAKDSAGILVSREPPQHVGRRFLSAGKPL